MTNQMELPANVDAEKTILGAILLDNAAHSEAAEVISPDDFSLDSHQRIFMRMGEMLNGQRPVDIVTLANELARSKEIDAIGGPAYLASLTEGIPRRPVIDEYVRIVKDKSLARRLVVVGTQMVARAVDQSESALESLGWASSTLEAILDGGAGIKEQSDVAIATIPAIEDFRRRAKLTANDTMTYGMFPKVDAMTGGMFPGEVTVIGGASGVGKSSVMVQSLIGAGRESIPAVCYSLEMTKAQLLGKMWSIVAGVPYRHVRFPYTANLEQKAKIESAAMAIAEWPLDIYDRASMNLGEVCASIKLHIRKRGAKLISVDYIQRMDVPGVHEERLRVSRAVMRLAQSVKGTPAHIQILSQLKRRDDDGFPRMKDLRESGQIENEAHCILLLWREYSETKGDFLSTGKALVPKSRFGFTGAVDAMFNTDYATYEAVT